jgi:hypothetical protein
MASETALAVVQHAKFKKQPATIFYIRAFTSRLIVSQSENTSIAYTVAI